MEYGEHKIVSSPNAPQPIGPYSQATQIKAPLSGLMFVSGQLGMNPANGELQEGIELQTRQSLTNVKAILDENGSGMDKVLKATVFINDMNQFETVNKIYAEFFPENKPARSVVEVSKLPKNALVEIEVIAHL